MKSEPALTFLGRRVAKKACLQATAINRPPSHNFPIYKRSDIRDVAHTGPLQISHTGISANFIHRSVIMGESLPNKLRLAVST